MAFGVSFLVLLAGAQLLRDNAYDIPPFASMLIVYSLCTALAILILRLRLAYVFFSPPLWQRHEVINWSWGLTAALVPAVGAVLWLIPLAYGAFVSGMSLRPLAVQPLIFSLVVQILLVASAEELFFREAGLAGWADRPYAGLAVVSVAFFIFHLPMGFSQALIAGGAGLVYGSLRVAGAGIVGIVVLHGLTNVMFSRVVSLDLNLQELRTYSLVFLAATSTLAAAILWCGRSRFIQPWRP